MTPGIDQAVIAIFGVAAVWLSQDARDRFRRWAPICGLITQPAWVYTTYVHEQWAILALTALYTFAWAKGFFHYWIRKPAHAGGERT
jgi:hypothetical protein